MIKKAIAVMTSGGDSPGMNAAVTAIARSAALLNMPLLGVDRGFNGLLGKSPKTDFVELNLEKALETISKRLLEQIKDGETPSRELGELAKVMKQAVEIRQELQEEHGGQETGVRVVFEREAEEFSE